MVDALNRSVCANRECDEHRFVARLDERHLFAEYLADRRAVARQILELRAAGNATTRSFPRSSGQCCSEFLKNSDAAPSGADAAGRRDAFERHGDVDLPRVECGIQIDRHRVAERDVPRRNENESACWREGARTRRCHTGTDKPRVARMRATDVADLVVRRARAGRDPHAQRSRAGSQSARSASRVLPIGRAAVNRAARPDRSRVASSM